MIITLLFYYLCILGLNKNILSIIGAKFLLGGNL